MKSQGILKTLKHTVSRLKLLDLLPVYFLAFMYGFVRFLPFQIFGWLQNEDGLLEWLSFAGWTFTAWCCYRISKMPGRSRLRRFGWILLAIIALFFAGEEVAWGERLTGIGIEAIRTSNIQEETSLHNLEAFQGKGLLHLSWIATACFLGLGRIFFPNVKQLPSPRLCLYFLIPAIWYALYEACEIREYICNAKIPNDQEIYEFLVSTGVAIYYRRLVNLLNSNPLTR